MRILLAFLVAASLIGCQHVPPPPATTLSAGYGHTCAIIEGRVMCWGLHDAGQTGAELPLLHYGSKARVFTPVEVQLNEATVEVAAGDRFTCARLVSGSVKCWGTMCGRGGCEPSEAYGDPAPAAIAGVSDARDIDAGYRHACAVDGVGGVTCWGANRSGQLGDGTKEPGIASVNGIGSASAVAVAAEASCALVGDELWCWGGQLKDQDLTGPEKMPGADDLVRIAANNGQVCAHDSELTVWCWELAFLTRSPGSDIADPEKGPRPPRHMGRFQRIDSLVSGGSGHCVVGLLGDRDGAWCWPASSGVVGLEEAEVALAEVAVGGRHKCGRSQRGELACWGDNDFAQFGHGSQNPREGAAHVFLGLQCRKQLGGDDDNEDVCLDSMGVKHGEGVMYWPHDRSVQAWGLWENGEKHGPWQTFYDNGALATEGEWLQGKQDGDWLEHGWAGRFEDGKRQGLWTMSDGATWQFEAAWDQGRQHTWRWTQGDLDVRLESIGDETNTNPLGMFRLHRESVDGYVLDCQVMVGGDGLQSWTPGVRPEWPKKLLHHGPWQVRRDGVLREEGAFDGGVQVGLWKRYDRDGKLRYTGAFGEDGQLQEERWEHATGTIAAIQPYEAGKPDGDWVRYDADGKVLEKTAFVSGSLEGNYLRRHPDGTRAISGKYKNNVRDGRWRTWHPNGQPRTDGDFTSKQPSDRHPGLGRRIGSVDAPPLASGRRTGTWRYWDADGNLRAQGEYPDGSSAQLTYYEADGRVANRPDRGVAEEFSMPFSWAHPPRLFPRSPYIFPTP